jgi:hypothetical protein
MGEEERDEREVEARNNELHDKSANYLESKTLQIAMIKFVSSAYDFNEFFTFRLAVHAHNSH